MKPLLPLAIAGLVFGTLAQAAAPPNMEAVNTVLPEEGAPKAVPGSYAVTSEAAFGNAGFKVFRPANLQRFPKKDTLPVVVWGHGGCAMENARAAGFLETIASHGFLVITTAAGAPAAAPAAGPPAARRSATAQDLADGISWAEAENVREGSPLKGKIQTKKVAVMGQSCGGRLSIEVGGDPRVGTIGVFNSGVQPEQYDLLGKLHGPVLLINGGERDFLMGASKGTFDAIAKLPAFYGAREGAGHTATLYHVGGGEWANVASNWVRWQFKKDRKAARMFVGKKCDLCTNPTWDVEQKRLKR